MRRKYAESFPRYLGSVLVFTGIVCIVAILSSCEKIEEVGAVRDEQRLVTDDLGHKVKVPAKVDRAISLAPNLTEMIFAVGAGDKLVGVTTYCNYPDETKSIEKVGDTQTPNIERIIALKPQVVFVSTASQLEAFTSALAEQGISVFVTNPGSLDDVFDDLIKIGDLFGRREQAENLVVTLNGRASFVRHSTHFDRSNPNAERHFPRVFLQISKEPLFTIGKDSFLTPIVELAGGESVTREISSGYPKISKETALALQPEVIVLSDSEDNPEPNEVFKDSPAVKNGRVYRINADIISRPGPRLVDALEQIAADLQDRQ